MANNDEITSVQSFTERTLKYGRNLMAVTVPIFVFALVPVVDLANSRPLNFAIHEGGEIWIWRILHGVVRADIKSRLIARINNEKARRVDLASARQAYDTASSSQQRKQLEERIFQVEKKLEAHKKPLGRYALNSETITGGGPISGLPMRVFRPFFSASRCGPLSIKSLCFTVSKSR